VTGKINRRGFLGLIGIGFAKGVWRGGLRVYGASTARNIDSIELPDGWLEPPTEFSLAPFWFWNDALGKEEIARQLDDFKSHGVYGFVIHPRAGLPRDIGWMSEPLIKFMRFTIEEAAKRDMWVVLYDEGMYPSGSSSGQVVAENATYRTRGLFQIDLDTAAPGSIQSGVKIGQDGEPALDEGQNLIAIVRRKKNGHRIAVVDRAMREGYSVIRGLHFVEDDPPRRDDHKEVPENAPPAGDILNPGAVACFIRLVYQRYYDEFKEHFGKTGRFLPMSLRFSPSEASEGQCRGRRTYLNTSVRILDTTFAPIFRRCGTATSLTPSNIKETTSGRFRTGWRKRSTSRFQNGAGSTASL
jgi:hypothetical protein